MKTGHGESVDVRVVQFSSRIADLYGQGYRRISVPVESDGERKICSDLRMLLTHSAEFRGDRLTLLLRSSASIGETTVN